MIFHESRDRSRAEPPSIKPVRSPSSVKISIRTAGSHPRERGSVICEGVTAASHRVDGDALAGLVGSMLVDDVVQLVEILLDAAERAPLDLTAAFSNGVLPLHDETA